MYLVAMEDEPSNSWSRFLASSKNISQFSQFLDPQNPPIGEFYLVKKHRSRDFKALEQVKHPIGTAMQYLGLEKGMLA